MGTELIYILILPCIPIPKSDCLSPAKHSKLNFSKYTDVLLFRIWYFISSSGIDLSH